MRFDATSRSGSRTVLASPMVRDSLALNPGSDPAEQCRMDASRIGTPEQFRWLHGIVKAVLVLNLADAVLTLLWVQLGLAVEANTLIDELVNENAPLFVSVKLALVGMGSWLLWNRRHSPAAVIGIFLVFLTYYWILVYHLSYAGQLIRNTFGT
jgi:hypothetical protein